MIKKTKDSKYFNPKAKVYTCPCGNEFYFKFGISDKCLACQTEIHEAIDKKLKEFKENQVQFDIEYSRTYIKRK